MKTIEQLKSMYVSRIVDNMDTDSLCDFVYDQIMTNLEDYSFEQLKTEISEYDPELLEEYNK